jgi:hypothetical protein
MQYPQTAEHCKDGDGLTTTNNLVTFDSATPGTVSSSIAITGLQANETILGIDFRPATQSLYGLGSSSRLYDLNLTTGAATQVGSAGAFTLSGNAFGFDFNPTVDRIRVVSAAQARLNERQHAAVPTSHSTSPQRSERCRDARIVGSAYTNPTSRCGDDAVRHRLQRRRPGDAEPRTGTLNTVGALGFNSAIWSASTSRADRCRSRR